MYATLAIRLPFRTGSELELGQIIDISLLNCMVAFGSSAALTLLHAGTIPKRWGTAHPQIAPFEVADGHMILAMGSDSQFESLLRSGGSSGTGGRLAFHKEFGPRKVAR